MTPGEYVAEFYWETSLDDEYRERIREEERQKAREYALEVAREEARREAREEGAAKERESLLTLLAQDRFGSRSEGPAIAHRLLERLDDARRRCTRSSPRRTWTRWPTSSLSGVSAKCGGVQVGASPGGGGRRPGVGRVSAARPARKFRR